jgi:hypothetical protein
MSGTPSSFPPSKVSWKEEWEFPPNVFVLWPLLSPSPWGPLQNEISMFQGWGHSHSSQGCWGFWRSHCPMLVSVHPLVATSPALYKNVPGGLNLSGRNRMRSFNSWGSTGVCAAWQGVALAGKRVNKERWNSWCHVPTPRHWAGPLLRAISASKPLGNVFMNNPLTYALCRQCTRVTKINCWAKCCVHV